MKSKESRNVFRKEGYITSYVGAEMIVLVCTTEFGYSLEVLFLRRRLEDGGNGI